MTETDIQLTDKQQVFIDEYMVCLNAAEAARRAGYSAANARQQGYENLTKPYIKAEIDRRLKGVRMGADEVLYRLSLQARGNVGEFIGLSQDKLKKHPRAHLIKKYKRTTRTIGEDLVEEVVELELYSSQNALVHLGKAHELFVNRTRVDDWRSEAIRDIRDGNIEFDDLAEAFDDDLATELFALAGVDVQVSEG